MATIAKIKENGSDIINLNDGTTADLLDYQPNAPEPLGDGHYDLATRLKDVLLVSAKGSTREIVANVISAVEEKGNRIGKNPNAQCRFQWRANNLSQAGETTLHALTVRRTGNLYQDSQGNYRQNFEVTILRSPWWEGSLTAITLDAVQTPAVIDNDDAGYVVLPALLGDLPAALKLVIATSGGNSANVKKVIAATKIWDAANFNHVLQVEEGGGYLDAALTNLTSSDFSPGTGSPTGKSWNPSGGNTSFRLLRRWERATNPEAYVGTFLFLLRVGDNAGIPNYRFRVRGGDIVGGEYLPGAWATSERITTPIVTTGTTELLLMSLGAITLPRNQRQGIPRDGVFVELWGEALAASAGAAYLDVAYLLPIHHYTRGAEFDVGVASNAIVLDSRDDKAPAYLEDNGDYLTSAINVTEGNGLYVYPRIAGQRIYFMLTRNEAQSFKHTRTNILTVSASYVPRWVNLPAQT